MIAYGSDKNKWAFQQQFSDGVILSLGISETEIFMIIMMAQAGFANGLDNHYTTFGV